MPSTRFQDLRARIDELRHLLLPDPFDPTGSYLEELRVTTLALSFRVLAHAELETYFEDRVLEVARTALKAWEDHSHVSVVTFHLIGFSGQSLDRPPKSLFAVEAQKVKEWPARTSIQDRFSRCVSDFVRRVTYENHGVKEQNIMEMFVPIGFNMNLCDNVFLQMMNQFGTNRGAVAHTSGAGVIRKAVDPKDEHDAVLEILKALEPVDGEFDRLLNLAAVTTRPF